MTTVTVKNRADIWFFVVPAAILAGGVICWLINWRLGVDSAVYRAGAAALVRGEPLYDGMSLPTEPWWALLPFTYPPAAAPFFLPLTLLPTQVAWGLLGAASVLGMTLVIRLCLGVLPRRPAWLTPRRSTLVLSIAFLGIEPVWRTLMFGQINLILMTLVVVDVLVLGEATGRLRRFAGVPIGVAAAIKLTPLIFVPHLLLTGRRAEALRATATFVGLQAVMFLLAPHDGIRFWGYAVSDPARTGSVFWAGNQSLFGLILRISHGAPWSLKAAVAVGAVLAVPAALLVRRFHRQGQPLPALLITAFFGLLVSPVSWSHHWVWAVPLIVYLLSRLPDRLPQAWAAIAGLVALVAVFASGILLILGPDRNTLPNWGPVQFVLGSAYLLVPLVAAGFVLVRLGKLRKP